MILLHEYDPDFGEFKPSLCGKWIPDVNNYYDTKLIDKREWKLNSYNQLLVVFRIIVSVLTTKDVFLFLIFQLNFTV